MPTGYVISDLHMFARWSHPRKYVEQMHQAAKQADFFVLNGDIFDLRWSILPGVEATIQAAIDWLTTFAKDHPNCTLYYILGNHDAYEGLAARTEGLAGEIENFQWRAAYLRIGGTLFTHGDLFWRDGRNPFERRLQPSAVRITRVIGWVYHAVHTIQATRIFHAMWPARRCARHIEQSLAAAPSEMTSGITDVYCGHTHVAVSDFVHEGITFHNTGSGIRGLRCNMCKVSIPAGCEVSL
jgi:UDP-2,3-diacylglucosamine pyrophosphatase LpxH